MAKVDVPGRRRPMKLDTNFFIETGDMRPHQVRLEGGDASSDSVLLRVRRREDLMDWHAMVVLGAYHGINPGMGWLFAVALGMQQGSARGVWRALPPIALGHAAGRRRVVLAVAAAGAARRCRSRR